MKEYVLSGRSFSQVTSSESVCACPCVISFFSFNFCKRSVNCLALCQQKDTEDEVREIIRNNLHLQGKVRSLKTSVAVMTVS